MKSIVVKIIVPSILLLFLFNCSTDRKKASKKAVKKSSIDTLTNLIPYRFEGRLEKLVKVYADSLNAPGSGDHLPRFLWNENLDVNTEIDALSTDHFISIREEIFKRSSNLYTIRKIVQSPHFKNQINTDQHRAPLSSDKFNNYQLALAREKYLMKEVEKAVRRAMKKTE